MQKDTDKTVVIFRKWKNTGEILALFPNEFYNYELYGIDQVMSYMHIGQHSGAKYNGCIDATTPAKPSEYAALKRELESIGYNLDVKLKRPAVKPFLVPSRFRHVSE